MRILGFLQLGFLQHCFCSNDDELVAVQVLAEAPAIVATSLAASQQAETRAGFEVLAGTARGLELPVQQGSRGIWTLGDTTAVAAQLQTCSDDLAGLLASGCVHCCIPLVNL